MKRVFYVSFCLLLFGAQSIFAAFLLQKEDIPKVVERLFQFHIEHKDLNAHVIRRTFKITIENFDPEKSYLLEKEVLSFTEISDGEAEKICDRLRARNYQDFEALSGLFERACYRAKALRQELLSELMEKTHQVEKRSSSVRFAASETELKLRQKQRMSQFYAYHLEKMGKETSLKRAKAYALFEKRAHQFESQYLFVTAGFQPMSQEKKEHLFTLRFLKAFARSLDTHTAFYSPQEAGEMRFGLEKNFEGVGVVLSEAVEGVMVVDLVEGSPAAISGKIQTSDLLVEINGKEVSSLPFEEVLELMRQNGAKELLLGFKRINPESKQEHLYRVALQRKPISMKEERIKTSYQRVDGGIIGTITLHSFYENRSGISSEKDIKQAISQFRKIAPLKGLVLDLRENSGGFLGQAVRVAGLFVSNGVIVISKYSGGQTQYLRNLTGQPYFDGPLVVLTSKASASAAEIVAQALQDYGVALVVGDPRTFGKGSIQYQTLTDPNADLFFKVTVGRYYTVSGRSTQIDGVIADIVVPTRFAPYAIGERYLDYPLKPDQVDSAYEDTLSDLDMRTRQLFQKRYLPFLQSRVSVWQKNLTFLRQKSAARLQKNVQFQSFLQEVERVRQKEGNTVNAINERIYLKEDLSMIEAVHIVEDMIQVQSQTLSFALTGTDG